MTKKYTDYTYRFEELQTQIEQSIEQLKDVSKKQTRLVSIINYSDDDTIAEFKDFVKDITEQTTKYEMQIAELNHKVDAIKDIIKLMKTSTENVKFFSLLSEALGIFQVDENK